MMINLISDAWIPVRLSDGSVRSISPAMITTQPDGLRIVEVDTGRPDFDGALTEFLIGLMTVAFLPEDDTGWAKLWDNPPSEKELRDKLKRFEGYFNLGGDGARAFQDMDALSDAEEQPIERLLMDAPGESAIKKNGDLFIKRGGADRLSPAAAAMALITLQTYAPSGGQGHRTSMRGGGPLTTLIMPQVEQSSLWSLLWANVTEVAGSPEDIKKVIPWLGATLISKNDKAVFPEIEAHPLQCFFAMPRRIRLVFTEGQGRLCSLTGISPKWLVESYRTINYGVKYEGWRHPLSPYYEVKAGEILPLHPQPGGMTYPHWPVLVFGTNEGKKNNYLAKVILAASSAQRRRRLGRQSRLRAYGYDMDNMKARCWYSAEQPLLLTDEMSQAYLRDRATTLVQGAQEVARQLVTFVKAALFEKPKEAGGDWDTLKQQFWAVTESAFFDAMSNIQVVVETAVKADVNPDTQDIQTRFYETCRRAALSLFDERAPFDVAQQNFKRVVSARKKLCTDMAIFAKKAFGIAPPESHANTDTPKKKRKAA